MEAKQLTIKVDFEEDDDAFIITGIDIDGGTSHEVLASAVANILRSGNEVYPCFLKHVENSLKDQMEQREAIK